MDLARSFPSSLPPHCEPVSPYLVRLSSAFNSCIPTHLALISTTLGALSVLAWLFAQLPQLYKNWRLQCASGLSLYFLVEWLLGDVTNLAGAILTGQAGWQVCLGAYYVFVDLCLTLQYLWFSHLRRHVVGSGKIIRLHDSGFLDGQAHDRELRAGNRDDAFKVSAAPSPKRLSHKQAPRKSDGRQTSKAHPVDESIEKTQDLLSSAAYAPLSQSLPSLAPVLGYVTAVTASPIHKEQLHASLHSHSSAKLNIGRMVSWSSALLYLASRLPQIYKNFARRSTAGLSPYMFLAAFLGNALYAAAMLTNPLAWSDYRPWNGHGWAGSSGSKQAEWLELAAPFFIGAAGVLILDATVGLQFLIYRSLESKSDGHHVPTTPVEIIVEVLDRDSNGSIRERRRWRETMSGWMRGWIPSISPASSLAEDSDDESPAMGSDSEDSVHATSDADTSREDGPLLGRRPGRSRGRNAYGTSS